MMLSIRGNLLLKEMPARYSRLCARMWKFSRCKLLSHSNLLSTVPYTLVFSVLEVRSQNLSAPPDSASLHPGSVAAIDFFAFRSAPDPVQMPRHPANPR